MSTGGIALLLASTPHRFLGPTTISKILFIFDIAVFFCLVMAVVTRLTTAVGSLFEALQHSRVMLLPDLLPIDRRHIRGLSKLRLALHWIMASHDTPDTLLNVQSDQVHRLSGAILDPDELSAGYSDDQGHHDCMDTLVSQARRRARGKLLTEIL